MSRHVPASPGDRYDFFLSRRGTVAAVALEVADALTEKGYTVLVQDYDIPVAASFVEAMHAAIKNARDLIILFTSDYERSPYTRKEFTSFEAERAQSTEERHIIILRCEDVPLRGLFADCVYQDLVGVDEPAERKRRIVAAAERQSQSVPPPPKPFIGVPPRIASFTGRSGELERLDTILLRERPAAVTQAVGRAAVQGMGGVGKTSLAVEYAHRYRGLHAGVWWCPAETRAGLLTSLAGLAAALGAVPVDEADVEKAAKAALRRLAEQRATWLLVYDNVTAPEEIADLLPAGGARVLITSRFSDWSGWAEEISLDVLPREQAASLLQARAGRQDEAGATSLAEALGRLPLALDHGAAYCKRTQMRFADYAAKAAMLIAAAPRGSGYPRSVAATFDLAIAQAATQCASAEALMAFLANCAPERIPLVLVEGAIEVEGERLAALAALTELSLVKHDPFEDGTPAVTVHRLVQAVARRRAEDIGTTQTGIDSLIAQLAKIYPQDAFSDPTSWPLCDQLTPHLLALQENRPDGVIELQDWPVLLDLAGNYFQGRASYARAEALFREALAIRETLRGPEHTETAHCLVRLALLLKTIGDFAGARPLNERGLAIYEKTLGPEHPYTAVTLNNLATLLHDTGDSDGARPLLERALAIYERVYGPEHLDTAMGLSNLARVFHRQGDYVAAEAHYRRSLGIYERGRGAEHPDTARGLNNLAAILRDQGNFAEARTLFMRSLAIHEKTLDTDHPNTNRVRYNLARLHLALGELAEALTLGEAALAVHDRALGAAHPWSKDSARVTADALAALGRSEEAETLRARYGLSIPE